MENSSNNVDSPSKSDVERGGGGEGGRPGAEGIGSKRKAQSRELLEVEPVSKVRLGILLNFAQSLG